MAIAASYPALRPSLLLDFANAKAVDPRITFTRSTTAKYYDGVTTAKAEENFLFNTDLSSGNWTTVGSVTKVGSTTDPAGGSTGVELNFTGSGFLFRANTFPATQITASVYAKQGTTNTLRLRIYNNTSTTTYLSSTFTLTADWERYDFTFTNDVTALCNFQLDVGGTNTGTVYFAFPQAEARSQATAYTPTINQPITNYIPVLQTAAAGVPRIDHDPVTGECLGLLIEEQRTNLLLNSAFNLSVSQAASSTTNAGVAPDGTVSAGEIIPDTSTTTHQWNFGASYTSGVVYTYSFFAKLNPVTASTTTFVGLNGNAASTIGGVGAFSVNLLTGGTTGAASATAVGNGWYRVAVTFTPTATASSNFFIRTIDASLATGIAGNGYSGVYIWGAQLEAGAFPTSYIPTVATQQTRNADAASMTGTDFSSWFNNGEGTLYAESYTVEAAPGISGIAGISDGTSTNVIQIYYGSANDIFEIYNGSPQATCPLARSVNVFTKRAGAYEFNNSVQVSGSSVAPDTTCVIPLGLNRFDIGTINAGLANNTRLNGTIKKIAYYAKRISNAELQALTS